MAKLTSPNISLTASYKTLVYLSNSLFCCYNSTDTKRHHSKKLTIKKASAFKVHVYCFIMLIKSFLCLFWFGSLSQVRTSHPPFLSMIFFNYNSKTCLRQKKLFIKLQEISELIFFVEKNTF